MKRYVKDDRAAPGNRVESKPSIVVAAWFGLVTGLIEGAGLLILQKLQWWSWNRSLWGVSPEIIWISAVFDLLLFAFLGLLISALARVFPRLLAFRMAVFVFAFFMFYDWLALSRRIGHWGVCFLAAGAAATAMRVFRSREAGAVRFWRESLRWVVGVTVLACVAIQGGGWLREQLTMARLPAVAPGSPNVLVIVVDTLRADHLSCYGYSRSTSPNLDRIARQGVLFENAIATSSWTLPSHASLLTGRYVYEHGADPHPYDGRYPTVAQALEARGYRTAAFSANTLFFTRSQGFGPGFIHFEDYFSSLADSAVRTSYGQQIYWSLVRRLGFGDYPGRKQASEITRSTLHWLARDPHRPFFAFLNYFDVHEPYLPPSPYRSRFSALKNPGGLVNSLMSGIRPLNHPLTPAQLQSEIDAYDGAISYADAQIGQLFEGLEKQGLAENTLLIITSDHGEQFGEHGAMDHRNGLFRELIHVPLILWWPGRVPVGVRLTQPVSISALPATLMEFVDPQEHTLFPGPSLTELWKRSETPVDWPDPLAEQVLVGKKYKNKDTLRSVVTPHWQFITSKAQGPEVFDWLSDARESNNLAGTPQGQELIRLFSTQLRAMIAHPRIQPPVHAGLRPSGGLSKSNPVQVR